MVKVTIENSDGINKLEGNAIFAIIPATDNVQKVGNVICCEGELNKHVVAVSLADLVNNAIDTVSKSQVEKSFLMNRFLDRMEELSEHEIGNHENKEPLFDFMEILRKAVEK